MSDFNYDPMYGVEEMHEPRVLEAHFGDGYEQRVGDGINRDLPKWNVMFVNDAATIDTMHALLAGWGGVTSFTWTPAGFSQVRVVCRKWSRSVVSPGVRSIVATFEQVPA